MTNPTEPIRLTADPDRGGFILHLPEITYVDTQVWSVDVGLTDAGLSALREALVPSAVEAGDRAALRDRIAAAIRRAPFEELRSDWSEPNGPLKITALVDDLADAVLPVVLSEPTDQAAAELASLAVNAGRALQDEKRHYQIACEENARLRAEVERLRADQAAVRATALSEPERTMLRYALDQAQEAIWSQGGFTEEDQAAVDSLRRLADEAQGTTCPGFETVPNRCGCPCEGCKHNCAAHEPAGPAAPAKDTPDGCTCAVAGDAFAPAGHYADCPAAPAKETPTVAVHAAPNLSPAAAEALDALVDVATAQMASEEQPDGEPIVAYRSLGGRILRCLDHVPPEPDTDFVALTAEDLPDGGICTFPVPPCGRDVLTVAEQPR